jgi:hypothetical protein
MNQTAGEISAPCAAASAGTCCRSRSAAPRISATR